MENRPKLLYPSMVIAAITVTVFSLLGIATLTGTLPLAHSEARVPTAAVESAESKDAADSGKRDVVVASACHNCGVVESVRVVEVKGQGSGVGAVAGGIAGALLGNGIGQGNGRTAMTLLGAGGGAYAGNEIEKNTHKSSSYRIKVRMADGSIRTLYQREQPSVGDGDHVKIVDGRVVQQS
jgi:outer membrane lipoprotein SlyB